jgi:hypothetical protein
VAGLAYLPTSNLAATPSVTADFANLKDAGYEPLFDSETGAAVIQAQHVVELRQAVNGLAEILGTVQPYAGADANTTSNALQLATKPVTVFHFTDLLAKINAMRQTSEFALNASAFAAPVPSTTITVRRTHVDGLRAALR